MKDLSEIRKFIQTRRATESLVLCTLVHKNGSSYRGVGAKKVVSLVSGESLGFLSGGCLEASIEKAAREGFSRLPFISSFSTLADEDRLLGYQTGCQGVIDILFEDACASDLDLLLPYGPMPRFRFVRVDLSVEHLGQRSARESCVAEEQALYEPWVESVRLFIIGCGADADVYGPLARAMGWSATFLDYRESFLTAGRFDPFAALSAGVSELGGLIPNGDRVAVVLMTHNFEADLEILRGLKDHRVGYLGCLGPAARLQRLLSDLLNFHGEVLGEDLLRVTNAPAGIFPHSQSPEDIALSVVAQIQGELIENPKEKSWTMILAAGASSRFGSVKALARFGGGSQTLLARALATAREVSGDRVLVVTGAHDLSGEFEAVGLASAERNVLSGFRQAHNLEWQNGMGQSIAFGVKTILAQDAKPGVIAVLPVDQPQVSADHLRNLISTARTTKRCVLTSSAEIISPPVAIPTHFFELAMALTGEAGLKSVLRPHQFICIENREAIQDIDRESDL